MKQTYETITNYINNTNGCKLITTKEEFERDLSDGINASQIKLKIECRCKSIFYKTFANFSHKLNPQTRCNDCAKISTKKLKTKTHEQFSNEVNILTNGEYTLIGTYISAIKPVLIKHNNLECGNHEFQMSPNNFLHGQRCPKCGRKSTTNAKLKTIDEFKMDIQDLYKDEYIVLGDYINNSTPIEMKHNVCGNIFMTKPCNILSRKSGCPSCSKIKHREKSLKKNDVFLKQVKDIHGDEIQVLGLYNGADGKILVKHINDFCNNYEWETTPHKLLRGHSCPKCIPNKLREKFAKSQEDFEEQVREIGHNEYIVIGKYINNGIPIEIMHTICGKVYNVRPGNFINGRRCPFCSESKGEQVIRHYCESSNIYFDTQYIFKDLSSDLGNPLRFDFAIFEDEEKTQLKYLIEYDGIFHYEKMYEEQSLEYQQYHDN